MSDKAGDLPQEVWLSVLGFLEDTDLQSLCLVNRGFRALCSDPLTWSHLRHRIQIPRLRIRLNGRVRRSRSALAERSILRSCGSPSILSRQIQAGNYVSGPTGVLLFETQRLLESKMRAASLNGALKKRRSWTELMDSGLLMVPGNSAANNCCIV